MNSVTFKFWVSLEFSHHGDLKPKRFNFCIEYKPIGQTRPFHYQGLELFGLLEEIGIESSVAFLKHFSIVSYESQKGTFWSYLKGLICLKAICIVYLLFQI